MFVHPLGEGIYPVRSPAVKFLKDAGTYGNLVQCKCRFINAVCFQIIHRVGRITVQVLSVK